MEKTFIKTNTDGKITAVITSNDPNLIFEENEVVVDISKHKDKDKIINNSKYFKFKSKKVSEMTATEKKKVDDDEKVLIPIDPMTAILQKINDRLDKIEKELKIKK